MAYEIISQNNNTTTLSDGTNTITVPSRVVLATGTTYEITEVNNSTATLEGSDGSVIRDVPCVAVLAGGGGGDSHNKGYYATQAALEEAHPTAEAGDWAIVGATDTVWVWDTDNSQWVDTDTKGQVTPDMIIVKSSTMPTASTTPAGAVYQYVGASDANYTHGYIYENVATTTSSSATASQTTGSSLSDVAVVLATFETQITTSGSYAFTSDGTSWSYDGNTVDLTDYGITYTGTPVADDVITVVYTESSTTYAWTRIDVQPSPNPLPSQTGQSGKFLTTDGTNASWDTTIQNRLNITLNSGNAEFMRFTNQNNVVMQLQQFTSGSNPQFCFYWKSSSSQQRAIVFHGTNVYPNQNDVTLGKDTNKWGNVYTTKINNGADITVPNVAGELAVKQVNTTITLTVADWSSSTQTVSVTGVTATSIVLVAPDPSDTADYVAAGILCTSQTTNSLTFTATTTPTNDIDVNIVCL